VTGDSPADERRGRTRSPWHGHGALRVKLAQPQWHRAASVRLTGSHDESESGQLSLSLSLSPREREGLPLSLGVPPHNGPGDSDATPRPRPGTSTDTDSEDLSVRETQMKWGRRTSQSIAQSLILFPPPLRFLHLIRVGFCRPSIALFSSPDPGPGRRSIFNCQRCRTLPI
jgi:hypothetical protein